MPVTQPETRLMSWEAKVIGGLGAVCVSLAILWLSNMWNAIEAERKARADMQNSIASNYMTKESSGLVTSARERQIEAIVSRIERNTDRIILGEERANRIFELLAQVRAEIAAVKSAVDDNAKMLKP
jgi:hypothetical protein